MAYKYEKMLKNDGLSKACSRGTFVMPFNEIAEAYGQKMAYYFAHLVSVRSLAIKAKGEIEFYCPGRKLEATAGINRKTQTANRKKLEEIGFISTRMGSDRNVMITVNIAAVGEFFSNYYADEEADNTTDDYIDEISRLKAENAKLKAQAAQAAQTTEDTVPEIIIKEIKLVKGKNTNKEDKVESLMKEVFDKNYKLDYLDKKVVKENNVEEVIELIKKHSKTMEAGQEYKIDWFKGNSILQPLWLGKIKVLKSYNECLKCYLIEAIAI